MVWLSGIGDWLAGIGGRGKGGVVAKLWRRRAIVVMLAAMDVGGFLEEFGAAAEAAGFSGERIAETGAGPMMGWRREGSGRRVYLSAGIHGDEPAGPLGLLEAMRAGVFGGDTDWTICPALNPTGLRNGSRDTSAGIDMNRDYLRRRSPEVAAHAAWLESRPAPELFLSGHEDWETSGFYFYEINLGEDRPERAQAILAAVGKHVSIEPDRLVDDHEVREPGWIFHAAEADLPKLWPEAIFLAKMGCPLSFTFETPSSVLLDGRVAGQVAAVRAVLECG